MKILFIRNQTYTIDFFKGMDFDLEIKLFYKIEQRTKINSQKS